MTSSQPHSIPGVTIERLGCGLGSLRISLDAPARRLDPVARQRMDEVWAREAARNPRLFDAPMLSAVEVDAAGGHIRCRRGSYRELVAHPIVDTGVLQVSVTGVCLGQDARGAEHVMLARRGAQTRIYGGMWELAPSGGLDAPVRASSDAPSEMTGRDAWDQVMLELEEELGLENSGAIGPSDPACLCTDPHARSIDIVFPVRVAWVVGEAVGDGADVGAVAGAPVGGMAWEYDRVRWVPLAEVAAFDARHAGEIIAPSRALLRWFGWV